MRETAAQTSEKIAVVQEITRAAEALNAAMAKAAKLNIVTEINVLDGTSMADTVRWSLIDITIIERLG